MDRQEARATVAQFALARAWDGEIEPSDRVWASLPLEDLEAIDELMEAAIAKPTRKQFRAALDFLKGLHSP